MSNSILSTLAASLAANPTQSFEANATQLDENEVEIYIHGIDMDVVKSKAIETEYQLQYGLFSEKTPSNSVASSHRVRMSITQSAGSEPVTSYTSTFKLFMPDGQKPDVTKDIDHETFDLFKLACDSGMEKTRYKVPFSDAEQHYVFEVDVFPNSEWVKVDLELPEGIKLARVVVQSWVESTFGQFKEAIYVFPADKVEKTPDCIRAHELMRNEGTLKGPFATKGG